MGDSSALHRHFLDIDDDEWVEAQTTTSHLTSPFNRLVTQIRLCAALPLSPRLHTGILRRAMPSIAAQTMVRQLISIVNTSIWSVRCRTLLKRLSMALVVLM